MNRRAEITSGGCFLIGLVLASSDGVWFPWLNFAGACVMAIGAGIANMASLSFRSAPRRQKSGSFLPIPGRPDGKSGGA